MVQITSFHGIAHPWLCDQLGHLNTRHYVGMFDDAMQVFLNLAGHQLSPGFGWADVQQTIDYKGEVLPGSIIKIDCGIIKIGGKAIKIRQTLINTTKDEIAAVNEGIVVLFDTNQRTAVTAPQILRDNAEKYLVE